MSIIRYRYKADKNFESVKIDGMSCSLGELKRLIAAKSSKPGSHPIKHDYDLIISDANTHEEYRDNSDLIPRNASVIVARRIRGTSEALTPFSNQGPAVNFDDIVSEILLPAIMNQKNEITGAMPSAVTDAKPTALEKVPETSNVNQTKELTENELIKEIQMGSQARYVTTQPAYRTNLFVCHNCKQPGHIKNQCPHIPQNSTSTSSSDSTTTKTDGKTSTTLSTTTSTTSTTSTMNNNTSNMTGAIRTTTPHQSGVYQRHTPYSHPYYPHSRGMRSHHRGSGHPREPIPKKTTGIPRDRLIPVPKHIPGALKDPTGASVVPTQMAELFVEQIEKKANNANQLAKQNDGKSSASASGPVAKSTNDDSPPEELLCPLCKQVCSDAVITPCCNFSFCDDCIRTALIESLDHKCPHCGRLHVAIDQINPNLFLRNHVNRWRERQNQLSYSHLISSQTTGMKVDLEFDSTKRSTEFSSDQIDEFDAALVSTKSEHQTTTIPIKNAPIVIKMQPMSKSQSPPPPPPPPVNVLSTRPADLTFEEEKITDCSQNTSSQKSGPNGENNPVEETPLTPPEQLKSESGTPPSHLTPTNPNFPSSSPTTSLTGSTPVLSHYYPPTGGPPHHLVPSVPQNVLYPHHIPAAPANGLYPLQPNYYPPQMGIRYPSGSIHPYPTFVPGPPVHPHHPAAGPPLHPHPHHHPMIGPTHVSNNPINGFNVPPYLPQHTTPFAATSTSTFITHHQTATQSIPTQAIPAALSEDEFYTKQRYFQRFNRSPSNRRRSRSRSSSYSSYSSSDSRSSSRSRYDRRNRRSTRSRSPRRTENRRTKSPNRNERRQRRSPSYRDRERDRRGPTSSRDNYSSKYRRSSPRRSRERDREREREKDRERERNREREKERERERERERRRSPRPPPTVQQSTQRTIVYMQESSTSGRTRSRSRPRDDRHSSSSSKTEQKSQNDSIGSSVISSGTPTLSSIVETVLPDNSDVSNEKETKPVEQTNEENSSKSGKKHKKHHHKKHRRQSSKSKKHRRSKDKDKEKKNTADSPSTAIVPVQS